MVKLLPGDKVPNFETKDIFGNEVNSKSVLGKWTLFYIYSRLGNVETSQHLMELESTSAILNKFKVNILGIAQGGVSEHRTFSSEHSLSFNIIADENLTIIRAFNAWQPAVIYGNSYMRVTTTLVISDPHSTIRWLLETPSVDKIAPLVLQAFRKIGMEIAVQRNLELNNKQPAHTEEYAEDLDKEALLFKE